MISETTNEDCMELMARYPDKWFHLMIADPPYGINAGQMRMGKGKNQKWKRGQSWDAQTPNAECFAEMARVSQKQIIFGGNYFDLPKTSGWIYWNKLRTNETSFGDGELAWTDFLTTLKEIKVQYHGFIGADFERIHVTQKPIELYRALLLRFAVKGQRILDPFLGSQSSRIAAWDLGFDFYGCELDEDYFREGNERFERHRAQPKLFAPEIEIPKQTSFLD